MMCVRCRADATGGEQIFVGGPSHKILCASVCAACVVSLSREWPVYTTLAAHLRRLGGSRLSVGVQMFYLHSRAAS